MRPNRPIRIWLAALCLLLMMSACGQRTPTGEPDPPVTAAPWRPEPLPAIAGEESTPPEAPGGPADGLEGSYYNDYLRETLILDGFGGCSVSWPGGVMGGFYTAEDGAITILLSDLRLKAETDASGDLTVAGRTGRYLRNWDFWGITPAEAGIHPVNALPDTEEFRLADGQYHYRDFPAGLALTYAETLQLAPGRIGGAVTVADGKSGYVVGRNVTERYLTRSGSAEEFLEDYIRSAVFADAAALYGSVGGYDALSLIKGQTAGRLAAGELQLQCGEQKIAVRVLLYTSAFSDGTEHFICKSMFAPAGETGQLDALAENVHDLGAARIVQLD